MRCSNNGNSVSNCLNLSAGSAGAYLSESNGLTVDAVSVNALRLATDGSGSGRFGSSALAQGCGSSRIGGGSFAQVGGSS